MNNLSEVKKWLRNNRIRLISIVVILFLLGWAEYQYKVVSKIWSPGKAPVVSLLFGYEIEDDVGARKGKPDDSCHSGDLVTLRFKADMDSRLVIVKVNSKGVHPVFQERFQPGEVEKDELYYKSFYLDETTGYEVYYAIAAYDEFDFDKELKPALEAAQKIVRALNAGGADFEKLRLDSPAKFTQKYIYFKHFSNLRAR